MWKYSLAIRRISLAIRKQVYTRRPTGLKKKYRWSRKKKRLAIREYR
jgi:hypothetical protein